MFIEKYVNTVEYYLVKNDIELCSRGGSNDDTTQK